MIIIILIFRQGYLGRKRIIFHFIILIMLLRWPDITNIPLILTGHDGDVILSISMKPEYHDDVTIIFLSSAAGLSSYPPITLHHDDDDDVVLFSIMQKRISWWWGISTSMFFWRTDRDDHADGREMRRWSFKVFFWHLWHFFQSVIVDLINFEQLGRILDVFWRVFWIWFSQSCAVTWI